MADNPPTADAKMEDQKPQPSDDNEGSESSSSSSSDSEPTETIASARPKRTGAGSLMPTLLHAEAEKEEAAENDDQIAQIFAEEEDDEDFDTAALEAAAAAAAGDAEDMSDSDDEENEQGGGQGGQGGEEYEGEVELMKRDRAEKMARKRKAHEGLKVMAMRKRARVEVRGGGGGGGTAMAPRAKKKSERVSWLPTPEEGPVRASSRRQTMQNKEVTHARLKDSEEKRVRLIATMEEAARRKERLKPKEMTQEERLAEAAKTERLNSKALNRWEEMEKRKTEEQRARLEALQNRRLEGPVLSFWSGVAKWVNGKLGWVGDFEVTQVPEKETSKRKKANAESPKGSRSKKVEKSLAESKAVGPSPAPSGQSDAASKGQQDGTAAEVPQKQITFAPPQNPENFLDGIHLYASMPAEAPQPTETTTTPQSQPSQAPQPQPEPHPQPQLEPQPESQPPQSQPDQAPPVQMDVDQPEPPPQLPAPAPAPPETKEASTRNLIILENFETTTSAEREQTETSILFNGKKPPKLSKPPQEMCVITSQPARYRDPETGLPYANGYAYREIRRLVGNQFGWSSMLGCFVGPVGFGARGVPERFLGDDGEKGEGSV